MERTYFPVLMLVGFVAMNAVMMLGLSHLTLRPRPTPVKQTAYESALKDDSVPSEVKEGS